MHRILKLAALFLFAGLLALRAATVEQWGYYEVAYNGPSSGNPFIDVSLTARFTQGSDSVEVTGFYDGDGVYRIRFMPSKTGEWSYVTHSNVQALDHQSGAFTASAPTGNNHGPVRVHNTFHFAYADGTPYFELGTTCYSWTHRSDAQEEQTLKTLAASPFNKIRMCVFPQDQPADKQRFFPYEGKPPRDWDRTRLNPAFFRHLEERVANLRDLGIEADLIIFHPYGAGWGFSSMDPTTDDRYVRYLVARLSAFRNVWWSVSNEWDFNKKKTLADYDRTFHVLEASDPYTHLRSIHNGDKLYNATQPWVTHASIQNGAAVEDPERAMLYRDVYMKPIVFDEVKYEGDIPKRWGQLTGEELVWRFWSGLVAGVYVGHSEIFKETKDPWLAGGGTLRGTAVARLAFFKKVMDAEPVDGIDPIDKWQDEHTAGKPADYYIDYFGREKPTSWPFVLYRQGLSDGMTFKVEILDTWNMTVTPVAGTFTVHRRDTYYFEDTQKRVIELPGKPYMALRITRVRDASTPLDHPRTDEPSGLQ